MAYANPVDGRVTITPVPHPLTPQQIDRYRTEGYFVAERLLDVADLQRIEACIDELVDAA